MGTAAAPTNYTSTEDIVASPFLVNQFQLQGTDTSSSGLAHALTGQPIGLIGASAGITQTGAAGFTINSNGLVLRAPVTFGGTGVGVVTINAPVTGAFDITKNGPSTFRFGSAGNGILSGNSWFGSLTITSGTIRFNNNATTGQSALRSNPVSINLASASVLVQTGNDDDPSEGCAWAR